MATDNVVNASDRFRGPRRLPDNRLGQKSPARDALEMLKHTPRTNEEDRQHLARAMAEAACRLNPKVPK